MVVLISLDEDEEAFKESFEAMPWLAVPCKRKLSFLQVCSAVQCSDAGCSHTEHLYLISPAREIYTFTLDREKEESASNSNFIPAVSAAGVEIEEVPISELVGKNVLLYFSAHG